MKHSLESLSPGAHGTPSMAKTRSGVEFDPAADLWSYRDGVKTIHLAFHDIPAPFALCQSLKRVLAWYAEHESPSHLENLFQRFKHFALTIRLQDEAISSSHLINYRSTLHRGTEWQLGSLSGLLKRWHRMGVPGIRDDVETYLNAIRIKGNLKGIAVLTMDPENGRLTDVEFDATRVALREAYDSAVVDQDEYALALLFMALGPRPSQYAAMKLCDFVMGTSADAGVIYVLSIPRAKQRGQVLRSSFKKRTLLPGIGELLREYVQQVERRFMPILEDPSKAPFFPTADRAEAEAPGFEFHRTGKSIAQWFKLTMNKLHVHSERTGRQINITPTRFRRTLACRAADEGHGKLIIADLLDHTDDQNAGVYVEATPGMMERIDRAVALKLAPLAQAFAGVIITDEAQARRAGDPTSRICDPRFDPTMKPVGNCGQFGFCGLLAPVACYTCRCFEPWLDGPHERVLDFLIAERGQLLSQTDKRIASINDRTILAVADVVRQCTEIKAEKKEDLNG